MGFRASWLALPTRPWVRPPANPASLGAPTLLTVASGTRGDSLCPCGPRIKAGEGGTNTERHRLASRGTPLSSGGWVAVLPLLLSLGIWCQGVCPEGIPSAACPGFAPGEGGNPACMLGLPRWPLLPSQGQGLAENPAGALSRLEPWSSGEEPRSSGWPPSGSQPGPSSPREGTQKVSQGTRCSKAFVPTGEGDRGAGRGPAQAPGRGCLGVCPEEAGARGQWGGWRAVGRLEGSREVAGPSRKMGKWLEVTREVPGCARGVHAAACPASQHIWSSLAACCQIHPSPTASKTAPGQGPAGTQGGRQGRGLAPPSPQGAGWPGGLGARGRFRMLKMPPPSGGALGR